MLDNQEIRRKLRRYRNSISITTKDYNAIKLSSIALTIDHIYTADNIGIFLSFDGEINTNILISQLWLHKKNVFLPIIHNYECKKLLFCKYDLHTVLVSNLFGILEPEINIKYMCTIDNLDIVFIPFVACNNIGYRLGMGKGFYDNTLKLWKKKKYIPIGLGYDFQLSSNFVTHKFDVPLFSVLTPTRYIIF
ncbi:5-formyltetrahydrofolate cyclo-ligase [Buchnera aphidicola (Eriosoma lanigerum)]|uniref:5-formyltetrahydrofolate cyclo-ligase n=1 Tax=Buchnera aphidicola TaxID=9 RepID=UPI003464DD81